MLKVLSIFAILSSALYANEVDWDQRWNELCTYDRDFCGNLKDSEGKWKEPKMEMVMALKELGPVINQAAKDFGVDPRAIAGSILAENSLNVSISDDIQDWLVKMKIAGDGDLLGKQFSFGWGQLYMDAAMEAEPNMAKIEGRPVRTPEEVAAALLKPEESIRYVAAVVRTIQDNYAKHGFDISDKPEILTTVYNLGGSGTRARRAKQQGRDPRVNYFGLFVEKNNDLIADIVNPEVSGQSIAQEEFWDINEENQQTSGIVGRLASLLPGQSEQPSAPQERARRATAEMILTHAPPQCFLGGNHDDRDFTQTSTYQSAKPSATLQFKEGFREVATTIDCDLADWKLVESADGSKRGWISLTDMKAKSRPSNIDRHCTNGVATRSCMAKLQKIEGIKILSDGRPITKATVQLVGKKDKVSWRQPYIAEQCNVPQQTTQQQKQKEYLTEADLKKLKDGVEKFQKKVMTILYPEDGDKRCFNCSDNPYYFLGSQLGIHNLNSCSETANHQKGEYLCYGDVDKYLEGINKLKVTPSPSWTDIKTIIEASTDLQSSIQQEWQHMATTAKPLDQDEIIKEIKDHIGTCLTILKNYPDSTEYLNSILQELDDVNQVSKYIPSLGLFQTIANNCESMANIYDENYEKPKVDDCTHCTVSLDVYMPNTSGWYNQQQFSFDLLKSMLKTDEEKDSFMKDQLHTQLATLRSSGFGGFGSFQQGGSDEDMAARCSYQPKETATLIDKIYETGCIQNVYVPDPWLVSHFSRKENSNIPFLKGFIENDRFEVDLKARKSCIE